MKAGRWFVFLLLIAFSTPASAEFYKYIDKDGHVRYTDDLSMVPEDQRPNVKSYVESKSKAPDTLGKGIAQPATVSTEPENQKIADDLMETKRRLDKRRAALENEREGLEKEKAAIDKEQEKLQSSKRYKQGKENKKAKELNERVAALNDKLKVFEQNKAAYEADEAAFNAQLNKALGK